MPDNVIPPDNRATELPGHIANGASHHSDSGEDIASLCKRTAELELQVERCELRRDQLRHMCRSLLDQVGSPGPLTEGQVRNLTADLPRLSMPQIVEQLAELRATPAVARECRFANVSRESLDSTLSSLIQQRSELVIEYKQLQRTFATLYEAAYQSEEPTVEEIERLAAEPPGEPIAAILAEFGTESRG